MQLTKVEALKIFLVCNGCYRNGYCYPLEVTDECNMNPDVNEEDIKERIQKYIILPTTILQLGTYIKNGRTKIMTTFLNDKYVLDPDWKEYDKISKYEIFKNSSKFWSILCSYMKEGDMIKLKSKYYFDYDSNWITFIIENFDYERIIQDFLEKTKDIDEEIILDKNVFFNWKEFKKL